MIELALKEVEKFFGGNRIFESITFEVQSYERVGLIGRNGCGKTTVFKIIAGLESQDKGSISIRKNATVGYLHQIPDYPQQFKVIDVLKSAFKIQYQINRELKILEVQMGNLKDHELEYALRKYAELNELYEAKGGYEIEEKMSKVCTGLKFIEEFLSRDFISLSGGEKTIVILGKILLENPDILLLDEPSNHLDVTSIEWLEAYLKGYKGTVIVISHDRYFLDRVVTKIVEIEDGETSFYNGNYSYYVKEKERRVLEQFEAFKDQQKKIKAMEKAIKQLRAWAIQADNEKFFKRAASMQKRLDKVVRVDKPLINQPKIQLDFAETDRSGRDVVSIKGLCKSFDQKEILEDLNLEIRYGECTALLGDNGSGKSTIIKTLLGEVQGDYGEVKLGSNTKIGYLPQNITFNNEDLTVIDTFREDMFILEGPARGILAKFLFYGESVFKKVKNLSGGEKSRLKLCMLIQNDINLLILDEPTNHLDIDSRENLEEALMEFSGTILFISHDRFFINKLAIRICEIEDKKIVSYQGNYEYYKEKKNEFKRNKIETPNKEKEKRSKNKENTQKQTSNNKLREVETLESRIQELESKLKEIDIEMNQNGREYEKLLELGGEKEKIKEQLDKSIERWMEIENS
ncbi:ABC-F type ribosomal protection protein [Clostridium tagluense]|uniref:ribosomal protection-like ABC-F family protein n=1 Tax=Clostridium tagluense TaxID=360422 RepID=UPI001C0B1F5D|nr:ABC-F type ribosomal protection protein [Clostridium tagluense]MBU3129240.1 ABC-F type ribosomal protection protein [Clostridium tagluense]MCB2310271.1 ABC-F type ribosomal protection protein [Clostridium tagluense]MCB2315087.1 ABC-F type ribosomal protection protein [Clostridium tagluense]MCB2319971.1 ABC-F type ribosomal protection protein [Clostridium tagluense]MCB2324830.1 ABC-F type ribosomal protection protein [Clostridium tagluense]